MIEASDLLKLYETEWWRAVNDRTPPLYIEIYFLVLYQVLCVI